MVHPETQKPKQTLLGRSLDVRPHITARFDGPGKVWLDLKYDTIEQVDSMIFSILSYLAQAHGQVFTKGLLNWARSQTNEQKEILEILKNLNSQNPNAARSSARGN